MIEKRDIIFALIKNFGWPVLIAFLIVLFGIFSPWPIPLKIKDGASSFFAILFFIMYFYGQYNRVEKQTEDKHSFKGVSDKLIALEDLVKQLNQTTPLPLNTPAAPPISTSAAELILEAKQLQKEGFVLAALLQAGVAFEHAMRSFAQHLDVVEADGASLGRLIQKLERFLPQEFLGEFHALRQMRNKFTHISEHEIKDLPDADLILRNYEWAISALGERLQEIRQ